jgi:general secretion pathway protein L
MLTDLLAWWWHQMLSLLPERARTWQDGRSNLLIVEPADASAIMLSRRRGKRDRTLGRFMLNDAGAIAQAVRTSGRPDRIVLRAPRIGALEHSVALPLAAERGVGQVLLHDMDRMTPFSADEVLWDWAVERRDRARGRLHVRLTLIPRAAIDPLLRRLTEAGIAPTVIETSAGAGGLRRLAVAQDSGHRQNWQRRGIQAAATACALLAMMAVALPFVLQGRAIARTDRQIAALQPVVAEAGALRRRIAGEATGANAVVAERARVGDAVAALAAITDILPDTTFLSEFSLAERQIAMSGQSSEAARLISALSSDPAIRNPSFAAPVTRGPANGADLFSIHAELAP